MRICPYCGKEIPVDAIYCPYCGKKIGKRYIEEIEIRIDDFTFDIKKTKNSMKVCGYTYHGRKRNIYPTGFECSFIKPDNYAFYKKLIDLCRHGYLEVIQKLLKQAGYKVSLEKIEEMCKEAERRIEENAERWKRIKKAWGLDY